MKTILNFSLFLLFFICNFVFSQSNNSNGVMGNVIPLPHFPVTGAQNIEGFRFRPGAITQLDAGSGFDFSPTSQWFAFGRLNFPGQTIYGIRIERAGKGLSFGYSGAIQSGAPTSGGNPFIQWMGNNNNTIEPGNHDFIASLSSTTSSADKLIMTLRSDGTALIGQNSAGILDGSAVGSQYIIPTLEINSTNRPGISVNNLTVFPAAIPAAINALNTNVAGLFANTSQVASGTSKGIDARAIATISGASIGIVSHARGGINNYGFQAFVTPNLGTAGINHGIYATVLSTPAPANVSGPIGNFAGYFAGTIYCGTSYNSSDISLKKDVKLELNTLDKVNLLHPISYNFKSSDDLKLNLSNKLQHGFNGQELETVFPELVADIIHPIFDSNNEQIGSKVLKGINYLGLISILTQSIKELSTEINILKDKNAVIYNFNDYKNLSADDALIVKSKGYYMSQNIPNPLKNETSIKYFIPENEKNASIVIFDLNGKNISEFKLIDASGQIILESGLLSKGIYLYSLIVNGQEIATKKLLVN